MPTKIDLQPFAEVLAQKFSMNVAQQKIGGIRSFCTQVQTKQFVVPFKAQEVPRMYRNVLKALGFEAACTRLSLSDLVRSEVTIPEVVTPSYHLLGEYFYHGWILGQQDREDMRQHVRQSQCLDRVDEVLSLRCPDIGTKLIPEMDGKTVLGLVQQYVQEVIVYYMAARLSMDDDEVHNVNQLLELMIHSVPLGIKETEDEDVLVLLVA